MNFLIMLLLIGGLVFFTGGSVGILGYRIFTPDCIRQENWTPEASFS